MLTHNFTMALDHFSGSSSCSEAILSPSSAHAWSQCEGGGATAATGRHLLCVCVCVCVYIFCYLLGTFFSINTNLVGTSGRHGDQIPVLMRQNIISEVLAEVRGEVWIEVRLRFGFWVRLSAMKGSQCNVLTRTAVQTCVCVIDKSGISLLLVI